ncbi:hypothetical protein VE04_03608 [Pseudogymnoascus sp. 24MN13]|nr:hypothetical protein VE04_03601 [Pseudogymnoascus sp. 24MN13]OBT55424.1 hypothetical protein VE04_03608 [Pseudogymnoascus sp. 24MN13]
MSSNHVATQAPCPWTMSTQPSTGSEDERLKAAAAKTIASSTRSLSAAQLERKQKSDRLAQRRLRQRNKEKIEQLTEQLRDLREQNQELQKRNQEQEDEIRLLRMGKSAANNNVSFGQNMGADTANTKRQIYTDNNMVGAFGKGTSTGDVYKVGEEGAFGNHFTKQPWELLASGNLYTTYLKNSFHEKLPMVGQPVKYRRLILPPPNSSNERRGNETQGLTSI